MIEVQGLEVTFNAGTALETRALRGVDLTVPAGQFVTVIGSNGAGKSTLLNALAGTARATRGRLLVDGDDVTPGRQRRHDGVERSTGETLPVQEDKRLALPAAVVGEPGGARRRGRGAVAVHG